ncbi:3-deoxy-7-phosphoheptulonate synthase [Streptomyces sp. BK022]|uniref:3-deoxy-7-phosphoheptulonate synthase n=1 Tax=Streptomyces sp. BK022 TaxID=2512123 RepID=UPI001F5F64AF|nr:3-deoxy-7-phosphoheptulonate synthase [Streptomyces sp. BK022]
MSGQPGVVTREEAEALRRLLARAASGEYQVIQAGDGGACHPAALTPRLRLLDALAGIIGTNTGRPVVRIGTLAGRPSGVPVWTSREALAPDHERPFLRRTPAGRTLLTSTHLPCLGTRTGSRPDGALVSMLADAVNPLACEVGPGTSPGGLLRLCDALDPGREPGRLTLVSRMGASRVAAELPPLVTAVREAGHPAAWMCDPMGGNTITARAGHRTRLVPMLIEEVVAFGQAVAEAGGVAAGLRLETTPDSVTECAWGALGVDRAAGRSVSPCGPRLNPQQAFAVAGAWG